MENNKREMRHAIVSITFPPAKSQIDGKKRKNGSRELSACRNLPTSREPAYIYLSKRKKAWCVQCCGNALWGETLMQGPVYHISSI